MPTMIIRTLKIKYDHQYLFSFLPIMHETTLQAPAKSKNIPVTFEIAPNAERGNEQKFQGLGFKDVQVYKDFANKNRILIAENFNV